MRLYTAVQNKEIKNQSDDKDSSQSTNSSGDIKDCSQVADDSVKNKEGEQLALFGVLKGDTPREQLMRQTRDDPTLVQARKLANEKLRGYSWEDGLSFNTN